MKVKKKKIKILKYQNLDKNPFKKYCLNQLIFIFKIINSDNKNLKKKNKRLNK